MNNTPQTTTAPKSRALRTWLIVIGSIVLGAVVVGAAISVTLSLLPRSGAGDKDSKSTVTQSFSSLDLDSTAADVTVRYGDVTSAELTFRQGNVNRNLSFTHSVTDGVLSVAVKNRGGFWWPFIFDPRPTTLTIVLPAAMETTSVALKAETTAGDLRVDGTFGKVVLDTTAGDITLAGSADSLNVTTSAGDVMADKYTLHGSLVSESTAGDIDYRFATLPSSAKLTSTAGDITFKVPKGDYRIVTHTTAGDVHQNADSDNTAKRSYSFDSTAGDITINGH